jgi:sec-independent protein translocase protein TatA
MLNIGPQELLLILIVALLVVGPKRLPELGRTIGKSLRELRRAQDEVQRTLRGALDAQPSSAARRPTPPSAPASPPAEPAPPGSSTAAAVSEAVRAAEEAERADPDVPAKEPAATEVARTLGRSLAELRRAREEVERTFRLDGDEHGPETT